MTMTRVTQRIAAVAATLLLLVVSSSHSGRTVRAEGQDPAGGVPGLVGTWFISVPLGGPGSGLVGLTTYDHSGAVTTTVSNMFGGLPHAGGAASLGGTDRGIWRRVAGGFEIMTLRMVFDPATADIVSLVRIRSPLVRFDGDRDHMTGHFVVALWNCPTPTTCPDPTRDAPDVPEFAPPDNTWTQSRVRFP